MPEIPLTVTAYEQRSRPFSSQRLVNMEALPAQAPAKNSNIWTARPGMVYTGGTDREPLFPCRGAFTWQGEAYFVNGLELAKVDATNTRTVLGQITGTNPVSIASTPTALVIANGAGRFTSDGATVTDISSATNLTPGNTVAFLDGFIVGDQGGTNGRFQWSNVNDPATYTSDSFASAESSQDRTVAVAVAASTLWVFGEQTIEPWRRNLSGGAPFIRVTQSIVEVGLVAVHSIARFQDSLFFLGAPDVGGIGVYRLDPDGSITRVSTDGIDYVINGSEEMPGGQLPNLGVTRVDVTDAEGWCYAQEGQGYYVLTFPTLDRTLVYNIGTNRWHERMSGSGGADEQGRWKAAWSTYAYNKVLVGESAADALYELSLSQYVDNTDQTDDELIHRIITTPPLGTGERRNFMRNLWLDMDAGLAEYMRVMMSLADDGGYIFGPERVRDVGPIGNFNGRAYWRQTAPFRTSRIIKLKMTDNCPTRYLGLYTEGGPGIG